MNNDNEKLSQEFKELIELPTLTPDQERRFTELQEMFSVDNVFEDQYTMEESLDLDENGKLADTENPSVNYTTKEVLYNGATLEGIIEERFNVLKKHTTLNDNDFIEEEIKDTKDILKELEEKQARRKSKKSALIQQAKTAHQMYIEWLNEELQKAEIKTGQENKTSFSALEWATVFYYADETKLLSGSDFIKARMEQFISKHGVDTTLKNLKTKYYQAKDRINKKNDYPVNKLEKIIPFLEENYNLSVTKVKNEILFLKENNTDY